MKTGESDLPKEVFVRYWGDGDVVLLTVCEKLGWRRGGSGKIGERGERGKSGRDG